MSTEMSEIKATASAHMRRDVEAGSKWVCQCHACHEFRSLIGMDKVLEVRRLVRELERIEEQLHELADGPEKRIVFSQYVNLHDRLADLVAK
jgi:hypothetical protein